MGIYCKTISIQFTNTVPSMTPSLSEKILRHKPTYSALTVPRQIGKSISNAVRSRRANEVPAAPLCAGHFLPNADERARNTCHCLLNLEANSEVEAIQTLVSNGMHR